MKCKCDQFVLYGLKKSNEVIQNILDELNIRDSSEDSFDIRLILTEALTNAFKHGNNGSEEKPIYLKFSCDGIILRFEVQDSGNGFENTYIPQKISDDSILDDSGRGLFLINAVADKVNVQKNSMIVEKMLSY